MQLNQNLNRSYNHSNPPIIKNQHSQPNNLPHLDVLRPDKTSTKLRVVFNPSIKGTNILNFNVTLLTGPKLQNNISKILLKFRFYAMFF